MLEDIRELLLGVSGDVQILDRPHRIEIIAAALLEGLLDLLVAEDGFIHLILECGQVAEVEIPLREAIALTGIQPTLHRDEVPKLIIGDERPRHEVIEITLPNVDLVAGIDVVNRRREHLRHLFPERLRVRQLAAVFILRSQLIDDARYARITILQEAHLLHLDPALDDRIVVDDQSTPLRMDADFLVQALSVNDDVRECSILIQQADIPDHLSGLVPHLIAAADLIEEGRQQTVRNIDRQRELIRPDLRLMQLDAMHDFVLRRCVGHLIIPVDDIDRTLQRILALAADRRAEMQLVARHGVPRVADHLVDDLFEADVAFLGRQQVEDRLQPVELVALRRIVQHTRELTRIQIVPVGSIGM